jgi:hypothetical protein
MEGDHEGQLIDLEADRQRQALADGTRSGTA